MVRMVEMPKKLLLLFAVCCLMVAFLNLPSKASAASSAGGVIKSSYGTSAYTLHITDIYMKSGEALTFASKNDISTSTSMKWLAASIYPGIGIYIGVYGAFATNYQSSLSTNIRTYANKGQGVHVTLLKDTRYGTTSHITTYWNGQKESIKPYAVAQPSLLKVQYKKIR